MEAVSAGASVLTFIVVALQSTKRIYEVVSDIEQGPAEVKSLTAAVKNLQRVLTELSNCSAVKSADAETNLEGISDLIKNCGEDVSRYEKELAKVWISPHDKKAGRAWKKLKTVLQERDFHRMWGVVTHHVSALGTYLSILQSNTGRVCEVKLDQLHKAFSERANSDDAHNTLLQQHSADMVTINQEVKGFKDESLSMQGQLRDTVVTLTEKLDHLQQTSAILPENVYVLFRALQDQFSGISNQISYPEHIHNDPENDHALLESIGNLCQLAKENGCIKFDMEAENIMDDLNALLQSALAKSSHSNLESHTTRKRPMDMDQKESNDGGREMKRLRSLIYSSDSIVINQKSCQFPIFRDGKIKEESNTEDIQTAYGRIIRTTKRRQYLATSKPFQQGLPTLQTTRESITTVKAILAHQRFQANLTMCIKKRTLANGIISFCSSISVGMIREDDSPIFGFVKGGDMDGLLGLLNQGQASLRDCDSAGAPLLFYAMSQPRICKFLVENGADVDAIAPDPEYREFLKPVLGIEVLDSEVEDDEQCKRNECRRLLLNAGADPTAIAMDPHLGDFPLNNVLEGGTVETLRLMLDLGAPFIELEQKDRWGQTPLLDHARNYGCGYVPAIFDLLLSRGSNIHARDNWGKTCLHICIQSADYWYSSNEQASLILLIRKGADINSRDNDGVSISEAAYSYSSEDKTLNRGGYRGDLWDAVLSECGHDITEMRKGFPRRPNYTEKYTRDDFEWLWRDREEFCPYYDDPSWWCPHKTIESLDSSKEDLPENDSESDELQGLSELFIEDEEDSETILPPLRDIEESTAVQGESLPPLSSIMTTYGVSMMDVTPSSQNLAWSYPTNLREDLFQVNRGSSVSVLDHTRQDLQPADWQPANWQPAPQTMFPARNLQAGFVSGEDELLESNPWQ